MTANQELRNQLGPLADLVGIWEGDKGDDIAPSDDRGTENNKYRERIVFEQELLEARALLLCLTRIALAVEHLAKVVVNGRVVVDYEKTNRGGGNHFFE